VVSLDFRRDFSKVRRLYSGKRGAVGQVTGVERPDVLLALQPALPRLRSLRPASKVARLADSLNNIWLHFERLRIWLSSEKQGNQN